MTDSCGSRHVLLVVALLVAGNMGPGGFPEAAAQNDLHDVSALAWMAGDSFLVVHDSKYPDEANRPRAGILRLPDSSSKPCYRPLAPTWPAGIDPSHDLESVSRIPGTDSFLPAESGDDDGRHQRLFLADVHGNELRVRHVAHWPTPVTNVEGMAVAKIGDAVVFIFAERAHGRAATEVRWMTMRSDPLSFGESESVTFTMEVPSDPNLRPVSSLEIDGSGRIFVASASDPDTETGPFRSMVWEIGGVQTNGGGLPMVKLRRTPRRIATLDGLKSEGLAVREQRGGDVELFIGTDDEGYGAVVRPVPLEEESIRK